jgi:multiple sugar transport system substrate-binding protein
MNQEIELSIMADSAANIQSLLDQFEAEQHIHVKVRLLTWDKGWGDLVKVALYGAGPDISEVGSTWLGDLTAMNALRPFAESEINALGRSTAFLPVAWNGGHAIDQAQTLAIPWFTGARLLFYRRALLAQAGLDERTAFQNAAALDLTLQKLQASGVKIPLTIPTDNTHTTLLNVASWVWGAGGEFVTADGKHALFNTPQVRAGLRDYFAMARFLAPEIQHLTGLQPDEQFLSDENTAVTLSGSWLFDQSRRQGIADQIGVALPPGPSFVGGSYLAIWKHSRKPAAALQLIRFLSQTTAQLTYSQRVGLLPARLAALEAEPFSTDPLWQLVVTGLKQGRSFPVMRSWGLIEERLTREFGSIWAEILAKPKSNLDQVIADHMNALTKQVELVLEQY